MQLKSIIPHALPILVLWCPISCVRVLAASFDGRQMHVPERLMRVTLSIFCMLLHMA
jgi:hypothetical protein